MIRMHLYVVRHAQSTMNIGQGGGPNCDLTELGGWQAQRLPTFFREIGLDAIYCSPLRRVIQTAAPLAKAKEMEIVLIPEMSEIFNEAWTDYRDYNWESCSQIEKEFPDARFAEHQNKRRRWWPSWPEHEADVRKRVQVFVNNQLAPLLGTEAHVAVFGHGQTTADLKRIIHPEDSYPAYNAAVAHYELDAAGICISAALHTGHLGRHVYE